MSLVKCQDCGKDISDIAVNCPNCGRPTYSAESNIHQASKTTPEIVKSTQTSSAKTEGAALGCLAGWIGGGCLISMGILLCFTGIGAFIGVPLILGGLLAPLLGPLFGLKTLKGACPWCGTEVTNDSGQIGFNCHACKNRIVIKNKKFYKIE